MQVKKFLHLMTILLLLVVCTSAKRKSHPHSPPPLMSPDPSLPFVFVDTAPVTPSGNTIAVGAGEDLQNALNNSQPGDLITLAQGSTYSGSFTLPSKSGSEYITVQTAGFSAQGRVNPSSSFAKISTPSNEPAIITAPAAHHFRFIGIELASSGTFPIDTLIQLGSGNDPVLSNQPHHIIFDRCYIHGDQSIGGKRGVSLQGSYLAVIDSYLSDWKLIGQDSQAIGGWNGAGPFKISNNYIEGAGENILFGGADAAVFNLTPSDIEIRNNHFFKPLTWKTDDPSYGGVHWSVKNLLELKHARRVLISGNLLENCWADGQIGYAVLFTGRNQSGSNPWAAVSDVTFEHNELRNSDNGFNLLGYDTESGVPSSVSKRLKISHNLATGIGGHWSGDGVAFQVLNGYEDVNIDHNTILHAGSTMVLDALPSPRLRLTNNILQHNKYGIKGTGVNSGNPTIAAFLPQSVITKNVLATPVESGWEPYYPPDNYFPATLQEIEFVNYPIDLHLSDSSLYVGVATDGTDLGYETKVHGAAMLPTTNLTAHFNASSNDDVFTTGGIPAADGQLVERVNDDQGKDITLWYQVDTGKAPLYRVTTPLMVMSCLDFDGVDDRMGVYNNAGTVPKSLADLLSASAKTILISIYVEGSALSSPNAFDNEGICVDSLQFFGLHMATFAGVPTLQAYNWDGNEDKVEAAISLNTSYVVMVRHDGVNLYMSINGGAESSVPSGATSTTTGQMMCGKNGTLGSALFNGRIGELAMYNVDLSTQGTDLAAAISYFTSRWLTTGETLRQSSRFAKLAWGGMSHWTR